MPFGEALLRGKESRIRQREKFSHNAVETVTSAVPQFTLKAVC